MDEFFSGLDCRLRVSGMLADSIMMGIVNSAMEDAYKKSCSKEGDLERLNEKSRFCELAIMQLEWCLKFLQEETDNNNIVESTCDREKLLSDLLETRDRIHNRLEETELAIAEKDRELSERMEIESNLRLALEVKDEDISSLHTALGLEREKSKRSKKRVEKNGGHGLSELKNCVDQQILKIRGKLEDGQQNLKNLMQKLSSCSLDSEKLISEYDVDRDEESCNSTDMDSRSMLEGVESLNLEIGFKEMVIDMDILKEKIDSSFKMMASSVSLFKTILDEQRWGWNFERETVNIIIRGFLREVQYKFNFEPRVSTGHFSPVLLDTNWVAFMDDFTSLQKELEKLVTQNDVQPKNELGYSSSKAKVGGKDSLEKDKGFLGNHGFGEASGRGDDGFGAVERDEAASPKVGKLGNGEGLPKENTSGHSVAEIIRNHECIIQKRTQEIDCLKGELSREKGSSTLRSERSLDSVKEMIARVISRVECIIKEKAKLVVDCDDPKWDVDRDKNSLQDNFARYLSGEKELKVIQSTRELSEQSCNMLCCHLIHTELCEEIKQLKQEKEDLDTKSVILEETYAILFKGLMRRLHLEYIDYSIDTEIREDTCRVIFSEMIKEWSSDRENIERLLIVETYCNVFREVVKDIRCALNVTMTKCHDENLPFDNGLFQNSQNNKRMDPMQEVDSLSNHFKAGEVLELDFNSESVEPHILLDLVGREHEDSNKQDDAFSSVNGKFEKALQQLNSSKMQLREMISSLGLPLNDRDVPHDQVTSVSGSTQDGKHSKCLPKGQEERHWNVFQFILMPLSEFSQVIMDFELIACDKIKANMTRLENLNNHIVPLVEQVNSIKKKETLYRKAFTRRCYDLQTAEVEVDLLGDEVDLLYGLVEKIYKVLNHYSPVLQHYCGIMDVLKLIRKQLNGEETSTTRQ